MLTVMIVTQVAVECEFKHSSLPIPQQGIGTREALALVTDHAQQVS